MSKIYWRYYWRAGDWPKKNWSKTWRTGTKWNENDRKPITLGKKEKKRKQLIAQLLTLNKENSPSRT